MRPVVRSTDGWSEREIVVLVLQRLREVLELLRGSATLGSAAARRRVRARTRRRLRLAVVIATAARAEHHELAYADLGGVARLVLLVLPLAVLDGSLDVETIALLHVLLDDVGEAHSLPAPVRVPRDAAMPLGLLLLVAARTGPGPRGGERERGDAA